MPVRIPGVRQHHCYVFQSLWTVWSDVGKRHTADLSANGMRPCKLTPVHRVAGGDLNNVQVTESVAGSTSCRVQRRSNNSLQQYKLQSDKTTAGVDGTCTRVCMQIKQSARLLPGNCRQKTLIYSRPVTNHDLMGGGQFLSERGRGVMFEPVKYRHCVQQLEPAANCLLMDVAAPVKEPGI